MIAIPSLEVDRLLHLEELNVEDQRAVGRDARKALAAVGEVGRNRQTALATNGHASNADIPALDDFTLSELKGEWGTLLVCCFHLSVPDCCRKLPHEGNLPSKTLPFSSLPM